MKTRITHANETINNNKNEIEVPRNRNNQRMKQMQELNSTVIMCWSVSKFTDILISYLLLFIICYIHLSCSLLLLNISFQLFWVFSHKNSFYIRRVLQQTVYGKLQTFPIIHCQDSAAHHILDPYISPFNHITV